MKIEKIFIAFVLLVLALKFRIINFPGGSMLLVLSLSLLSTLYALGGFYIFSIKNAKSQDQGLSIASGIFLSTAVIGILFKLMYWSGAPLMLMFSFIAAVVLLFITRHRQSKSDLELQPYYRNMIIRWSICAVLTVGLYFTPMHVLIHFQYRHDPELARLKTLSYTNPQNEEYKKALHDYEQKKYNPQGSENR